MSGISSSAVMARSVYGFVHRAFLEFFCADYYVQQFEKLQELSIAQLKQQVFAAHWADPSWREVLRLISRPDSRPVRR